MVVVLLIIVYDYDSSGGYHDDRYYIMTLTQWLQCGDRYNICACGGNRGNGE